jgi:predicted transcriptional regulator
MDHFLKNPEVRIRQMSVMKDFCKYKNVSHGSFSILLVRLRLAGYTFGMKTAISIPDELFETAELLVEKLKISRSKLYARAIAEFVANYDNDLVTEQMDQALREIEIPYDEFSDEASRRVLTREEW